MSQELNPTIENPFAEPAKSPAVAPVTGRQEVILTRQAPNRFEKVVRPEDALPDPGYYLSVATKRHIADLLSKKAISEDELPYLYSLFQRVAVALGRRSPTFSDVEIGISFRTEEEIQAVASGERTFVVKTERPSMQFEIMTKQQQKKYWQDAAQRLMKGEETAI